MALSRIGIPRRVEVLIWDPVGPAVFLGIADGRWLFCRPFRQNVCLLNLAHSCVLVTSAKNLPCTCRSLFVGSAFSNQLRCNGSCPRLLGHQSAPDTPATPGSVICGATQG